MRYKKTKALILLSGGLDSILAAKLLLEQGIEVEAINFRMNFCGPSQARLAAKFLGVLLREVNISEEFSEILKKPKYGYGAGMNPCIDCHALMLKKAAEIMRAEHFDLVATGEVIGERPMSQHKKALLIVEKEAGLEGYLLRPLSAKLLEPTIPETRGAVDREKLLDISGRSRKIQIELAKKYGIRDYPAPAGGCALTQKGFAERLKELMKNRSDFTAEDLDLIKIGRHFWVDGAHIILGRNQKENEILKNNRKVGDVFAVPLNFSGPEALIKGRAVGLIEEVKRIIIQFSPKIKDLKGNQPVFEIK